MNVLKLAACLVGIGLFAGVAAHAADQQAPSNGQGGHSGFKDACGADLDKFCSAAKLRDERHTCIDANKDKFSDSCKTFMAAHPRPNNSSTPPKP
jgi:hypothetical protein